MSRFDFVRPGGQWPGEVVPGANDFQRFDDHASKAIDADNGGTYTPTSPIVLGGAGVAGKLKLSGGVRTGSGGRIIIASAAGDFPQLVIPRSRTIRISSLGGVPDPTSGSLVSQVLDDAGGWGIRASKTTGGAYPGVYWPITGRDTHVGGRLARVGLEYRIPVRPTSVPTGTPLAMAVRAYDDAGSVATYVLAPEALSSMLAWTPGWTGFGQGVYTVGATSATQNGLYFRASFSGTPITGSVEPIWPTVVGGTVTDNPGANQVVWTAVGRSGIANLIGATLDSYWMNGAPQTLWIDLDASPTLSGVTTVWPVGARMQVQATDIDPAAIVTGLVTAWDTIGSLAFA